MKTNRLDLELVDRGMLGSRSLAQRMVMAGQVRVDGQVRLKPSTKVAAGAQIEIDQGPAYVSRGGLKLEAALDYFDVDVTDRVCADIGASTGGFTDCLLQRGAKRVYAIDVGRGILDWKLRNDRRVIVMEATNARYLTSMPERISLVTIDVSFISIKKILPAVMLWISSEGEVIALIKPQFEAGKREVSRGKGVIKDPQVHKEVLEDILEYAQNEGLAISGLLCSPVRGPKGNTEFLAHLCKIPTSTLNLEEAITQVIDQPQD